MDLTLFAVTRALDVMVGELWSQRKLRKTALGQWSNVSDILSRLWHWNIDYCKGRQTDIGIDRLRNILDIMCLYYVGMGLLPGSLTTRLCQMDQVSCRG